MKNKSPIDNIVNDKEKKVKPKKKDTESITKNIDSKVNKSVNKKTKSTKKESLTNKKAVIVNDSNNLEVEKAPVNEKKKVTSNKNLSLDFNIDDVEPIIETETKEEAITEELPLTKVEENPFEEIKTTKAISPTLKKKLGELSELLLDTTKKNNLINFTDSKTSTLEIIYPDIETIFSKVNGGSKIELYNPKIITNKRLPGAELNIIPRTQFIERFSSAAGKNRFLIYNSKIINPFEALKTIHKKATFAITETSINVLHLAFGFVEYHEKTEKAGTLYRAPILLLPIHLINDSMASPYYLQSYDADEVIINPTFAYKLQSEYGQTLPQYNEDEGLSAYLDKVEKILSKFHWTIKREVKMSTFSFSKINMYRNVKDDANKILENSIIQTIFGEQPESVPQIDENDDEKIEIHNIFDADSSQTEAIKWAKQGRSFVLQGPPGTGKSQTISNIIAECMHDGKTVLFVSEKQAALQVVFDKLKRVGLDEYCLKLHSSNANKKVFIDSLCTALKSQQVGIQNKAQVELETLDIAQKSLAAYDYELHKKRDVIGISLFDVYEKLALVKDYRSVKFEIKDLPRKDLLFLDVCAEAIDQFSQYIDQIGADYRTHYWYGFRKIDLPLNFKKYIQKDMELIVSYIDKISKYDEDLDKAGIPHKSINDFLSLFEMIDLISNSNSISPALLKTDFEQISFAIHQLKTLSKSVLDQKSKIDRKFKPNLYEINGENILKKLKSDFSSGKSRLFSKEYKNIINSFESSLKLSAKVKYEDAIEIATALSGYQAELRNFKSLSNKVEPLFPFNYDGLKTDWDVLNSDLTALIKISRNSSNKAKFAVLSEMSNNEYLETKNRIIKINNFIASKYDTYSNVFNKIDLYFDIGLNDLKNKDKSKVRAKLAECIAKIDTLEMWVSFLKNIFICEKYHLRDFFAQAAKYEIEPSEFADCFRYIFLSGWADYIIQQTPELSNFSRIPHDNAVKKFVAKDLLSFNINKAKIKSAVSSRKVGISYNVPSSPAWTILREGEKKRNLKPIRTLLAETYDVVKLLKPCVLMSPLSVSTYLQSDKIKFDVVIFDEASQIFPQDALVAIYRAKQAIIVGDSKQMPPTNFFNSAVTDSEDDEIKDESLTNFESILDVCAAALPSKELKWHYRSRHEELIAFSNRNFYKNNLVSCPNSKNNEEWSNVQYFYVPDAIYERKSHTNLKEAEYVVDLVFKNAEKFPKRSLGVITFSVAQESLIERLIYDRLQQQKEFEKFFNGDGDEPFFVKNLETVQGDERDTIIISTSYGIDQNGRFINNFGPINSEGGERRLNVAITRAKDSVQVVSSMHYTMIDDTSKSKGAILLRDYLNYAENGPEAVGYSSNAKATDDDNSFNFEQSIADFLTENGFLVKTRVGLSKFKIDVAVRDPNNDNYLLAIECDGNTFHSLKTVRDRDRLRKQMLESKGWEFYRIWSIDWFANLNYERQQLLKEVKRIVDINKKNNTVTKVQAFEADFLPPKVDPSFTKVIKADINEDKYKFPHFKWANMQRIIDQCDKNPSGYGSLIKQIIETEGPVNEDDILKRTHFFLGRESADKIALELYKRCAPYIRQKGLVDRDGFWYLKDQNNIKLHIPKDEGTKRDIKNICNEELADGLLTMIETSISVDKNALFKELVTILGYERMTPTASQKLEEALLLIANKITIEDNLIHIKK